MLFAEVRLEDWLWMTDSQQRGKSGKERDEPRMVGNTMGIGSKEERVQKEDASIKEGTNQRPS